MNYNELFKYRSSLSSFFFLFFFGGRGLSLKKNYPINNKIVNYIKIQSFGKKFKKRDKKKKKNRPNLRLLYAS